MTTKLLWTALPNHVSEDGLIRLSVHVAPRLEPDGSLEDFDAVAVWPETLEKLTFRVEFGDGTTFDDLTPDTAANAALWQHVFPGSTRVGGFEFRDHGKRDLHVFPVRDVLEFLKSAYVGVAQGGANVPSIDDPEGPLAPFHDLAGIADAVSDSTSFANELYKQGRQAGQVIPESDPLTQAYRFYHRPGSYRNTGDFEEEPPRAPEFEFHERVALLGDHPELLRRLGLVLDLTLDARPEDLQQQGIVRVTPSGDLPDDPDRAPWTAYEVADRHFGPRANDAMRMGRGLLRLNKEFFDLFHVDVDGGALKAVAFGDTLTALADPTWRRHDTPDEATVPALRSAGLAVARVDRGEQLLGDLDAVKKRNSHLFADPPLVDPNDPLHAEDVTRGCRLDVYDAKAKDGSRWFSLNGRVVSYEPKDGAADETDLPFSHEDEGYVKGVSASTERVKSDEHKPPWTPSDDLYLHEALFGWEGWSLSAPRLGKRIVDPGDGEDGGDAAAYDAAAENPNMPITISSEVQARTLPRLRVGHAYRMRARLVDLAGNSLPFTEEDLPSPTPDFAIPPLGEDPEPYLRFEPVTSPTLLRRHPDTEGESAEHLVIRSNYPPAVTAATYAASDEVEAALESVGALHSYAPDSQRHLAPPKSSQSMAEQHGRFEKAFGDQPQPLAAYRAGLREEGSFLDEKIVDLATGQKTISQLGIVVHPSPPGQPLPLPAKGEPLPDGAQYVLYTGDKVKLPYLPDPLAAGVSIVLYDRTGAEVAATIAPFPPLDPVAEPDLAKLGQAWPELEPFRLALSEGALATQFKNGLLEVRLPKAAVVTARLSSLVPAAALDWFAIWRWLPEADRAALLADASKGRLWLLTPFRRLTFTHAVQQPLEEPDFEQVTHTRDFGQTSALFLGPIGCHAGSTSRLDVSATWTEEVDLLTDDEPRWTKSQDPKLGPVPHSAVAFGFDIAPGENGALATARVQGNWRRCVKCEGLVFAGHVPPQGTKVAKCPAGGAHRLDRRVEYRLFHQFPEAPGQDDWRWCSKCEGLAYGGNPAGPCPAGGVHVKVSGNYTLVHNEPQPPGQPGWRWCKKCQGLAYAAGAAGPCPAGGTHDHSGSGAYALHTPLSVPVERESRHEFGDTKYRKVTYRSTATTRFREFFPTSITDVPEKIQRVESDTYVHQVLSTARPAAPDVVSLLPTFRWEHDDGGDERVHVRHGKSVRVYLRRPWFSSGDGEQLAVVLRKPPPPRRRFDPRVRAVAEPIVSSRPFRASERLVATPRPAGVFSRVPPAGESEATLFGGLGPIVFELGEDPLLPYVTNWGSDPVWQSPAPREHPGLAHFPAHVGFGADLMLDELSDPIPVLAAAHDVQYDGVRRLWYCDIEIDPGDTYFPLVRLALARYQAMSLPGVELSRVVMTDFIQLLPDRTARVQLGAGTAAVKVEGFSGRNLVADKETILGLPTELQPSLSGGPSTKMRVALEVNGGDGDDLAWTRVGPEVTLDAQASGFRMTWSGTVDLPENAVGSGAHRLLVTEVEDYERDLRPTETASIAPLVVIDKATGEHVRITRERLVYADEFLL